MSAGPPASPSELSAGKPSLLLLILPPLKCSASMSGESLKSSSSSPPFLCSETVVTHARQKMFLVLSLQRCITSETSFVKRLQPPRSQRPRGNCCWREKEMPGPWPSLLPFSSPSTTAGRSRYLPPPKAHGRAKRCNSKLQSGIS